MSDGQMTVMAQRLNRLERSHLRWKLFASGLLGILALISLLGATTQIPGNAIEEIRAKRFLLVDEDGNARGELAVQQEGSGLSLKDKNGIIRALLVVTPEGPSLELRDGSGKARTSLGIGPRGQSIIQQNIIRTIPRSQLR